MTVTIQSPKNNHIETLSKVIWKALDWLYPASCCNCGLSDEVLCRDCFSQIEVLQKNKCVLCGYPISNKRIVCVQCAKTPPVWNQMVSWAVFDGALKKAIHSLKYHKNLAVGAILAEPLEGLVSQAGWEIDLIVPVPLSKSRMRERGYNQSSWIARPLARKLGVPFSDSSVKRVKQTEKQTSLDVNKRFMNLMDAFYANPAKLEKRHVLVIDDVITTRATMHHCTLALLKAGAESAFCLSVARAILRKEKSEI